MLESDNFISDFNLLIQQGVVGFFECFELLEIFAFNKKAQKAFNVITVAVATENLTGVQTGFLTKKLLNIKGLNDLSFGVKRSELTIENFRTVITTFQENSCWTIGNKDLQLGEMMPIRKAFVPPDMTVSIPINRILKNNFHSGSYVLELFDTSKRHLSDLLQNPTLLQDLSSEVSKIVPIPIGSLSDRLGNIIIQFPIEVIRSHIFSDRQNYCVEVAWHPKIKEPRQLIANFKNVHDQLETSIGLIEFTSGQHPVCPTTDSGLLSGSIWDRSNNLQLASISELGFITTTHFNIGIGSHEPRVFPSKVDSDAQDVRLAVVEKSMSNIIGQNNSEPIISHIQRRLYDAEIDKLVNSRKFIQYGTEGSERTRALNDLRSLISQYGQYGVWLWDPYLNAQDIVNTLFYNPSANTPMRALTNLQEKEEAERLLKLNSNFYGLDIEFRSANGLSNSNFHDRFLIFPKGRNEKARAWSLGTSVNSLGKSHHILQQVDHAQMVADAFARLWNAAAHENHIIWKYPNEKSI